MAEAKRLHTPEGTPPSHRTLTTPHHSHLILQSLQELYKEGALCDYTILAEGQEFKTHRNVLASVSDYFRVMLTGPMIEARQDHVNLKGVTAAAMKTLLNFAYTGRLCLNMDDVMETLSGASHLQMRSAIELCSDFLISELSRKSCIDIMNMAEMYALADVRKTGICFVTENFDKIVDSDQFFKIHKDHLAVILQSNKLHVASELQLFHLLWKWVDFDASERLPRVYDLLQHIRFTLMKPEDLVDQVASSNVMSADERCRTLIDEALQYHVLPTRHPVLQTKRTQIRNEPCMIALGGRYGINIGYKFNSNKMFALFNNKWYPVCNTDSTFLYAAACVLDNFLYVCGGMGKPAHARATCQRYDPRTGIWTRLSHMRTRRQSFPLVPYQYKIFALGGGMPLDNTFEHPPTEKCEVYSVDRNEWQSITPFPGKRKSASACELDGKIYVSGGRTDNETASNLWCYEEDRWEDRCAMILPHAGHAMLPLNNKLYVIDRIHLGIECYNPAIDEWSKITAPSSVHSGIARPSMMGPWVYFISYIEDERDYQCKRYNVLTLQEEELPSYPDEVHCVISAPLTLPRSVFMDANNNSGTSSGSDSGSRR